jgi:4-amino-4-deoxy-L-arabinose transferase-like glycosyltransferase
MNSNFHLGVWVCCLAAALSLPELVSLSLDFDGLIYSNIAQQLASGVGSFWSLPYFDLSQFRFYDHPPLGIWLLGSWYSSVGTWLLSEKLYALVFAIILGLLFRANSKALGDTNPLWFPSLILLSMPVLTSHWFGGYLEIPTTVITTLAVLCCLKSQTQIGWALLAGLLVYLAVLIKGPVGLFPLATPLALWFFNKSFLPAFSRGVIMLSVCLIAFGCTHLLYPEALEFWKLYIEQQLVASITGLRTVEHTRGDLVVLLTTNIGLPVVVLWLVMRLFFTTSLNVNRTFYAWLIIAVCASVPQLLSARHYDHYILPSLPFFALAISSLWRAPAMPSWVLKHGMLVSCTSVSLVLIFAAYSWQTPGRHADEQATASRIAQLLGDAEILGYCEEAGSIKERSYLMRYHNISSTTDLYSATGVSLATGVDSLERVSIMWVICGSSPTSTMQQSVQVSDQLTLWRMPLVIKGQ